MNTCPQVIPDDLNYVSCSRPLTLVFKYSSGLDGKAVQLKSIQKSCKASFCLNALNAIVTRYVLATGDQTQGRFTENGCKCSLLFLTSIVSSDLYSSNYGQFASANRSVKKQL